jgi:tRNA/tmRNA/rRNA uracil-C5-methylase (TrmA/RlmC/RlmD family)
MKNSDGNIMVRMKDHKWFVPTALNGKTIVLEGTAEIKETSVAQLKHYAEDAGKSKAEIDAIKEPKKEVLVQAKGIVVI